MQEDLKDQKRYASIEALIKIPPLVDVPEHKKLFEITRVGDVNEVIKDNVKTLIETLNSTFKIYENSTEYEFQFPESKFPSIAPGERNLITYEQKNIVEEQNTFKNKLSTEQIKQIAAKGEFNVKSNVDYITLPYVWKINETLFWGKEKVERYWLNSLAKIYGFWYKAQKGLRQEVPKQLHLIQKLPARLLALLFGRRKIRVALDVDYGRQLNKEFWKKIINNCYSDSEEWSSALWNYFYLDFQAKTFETVKYIDGEDKQNQRKRIDKEYEVNKYQELVSKVTEKKNKLYKVHNEFGQSWPKLKKKVFMEVNQQFNALNNSAQNKAESEEELLNSNKEANNDEKILDALAEKKFTLYLRHIEAKLPKEDVPPNVIKAIVFILQLFKLINSKVQKKNKKIVKRRQEVEQAIKQRHPIKSLCPAFYNDLLAEEMNPINKYEEDNFYNSLKKDDQFVKRLNANQIQAYKEFLDFKFTYENRLEAKKRQIRILHEPERIFYSNYLLTPPYKSYREGGYYYLKKRSDDVTVDTSKNFWKLSLYVMRIKTWTINSLIFLLFNVLKGPVGFRCLYGIKDFQFDTQINGNDGTLYHNTRKTVLGNFLQVLDGMKKSRANFQALPDLGLFGKNVSRIFNYLECYVFRFFFVGVILVLILYPILIVICSILSTILLLTFWAWMPITLTITYLFNIFIYQFQSSSIPYPFGVRLFPLLVLVFILVKSIVLMLLLLLYCFVFIPLKITIVLLLTVIQKYFRKMTDFILLFLIKKLGRTPSRDSAIAKKISGPGMSKQYYMSINEEDVYVLIQSELEKIYVNEFNRLITQRLNKNSLRFTESINYVLGPFNQSYYNYNSPMMINSSEVINNYNNQYRNYMARYPQNPYRVRFTQDEIDSYFENTQMIVKNFVEKHGIEKWIFDRYQLYEDMYDELTRVIWKNIFNCGEEIFQPLEKLDVRFKLEDQYENAYQTSVNISMKKNVGSVMRALEGEVKLNQHQEKLSPFKHHLLNRERPTGEIADLISLHDQNTERAIALNREDLRTLFIPNLNIEEVIKYETTIREEAIKNNPKILDL